MAVVVLATSTTSAGGGARAGASAEAAPSAEGCARSYERAQEQRGRGLLTEARQQLMICAQTGCPGFVVQDCRRWLDEVESGLPSVVFAVRQGGRDLDAVSVQRDGVLLTARLDGRAITMDPGKYRFTFVIAGTPVRTVEALIVEGKKNRLIEIDLPPPAPPPPAVALAPVRPPRPAASLAGRAPEVKRQSRRLPLGFAAVGAAGIAGFAGFGWSGLRDERRMRDECAPACSGKQVQAVRRKYLLADVGLGLGLGSLAVAAYLHSRPAPAGKTEVGLNLGEHEGWLQVARRF